jgi:hypothetical protein
MKSFEERLILGRLVANLWWQRYDFYASLTQTSMMLGRATQLSSYLSEILNFECKNTVN